jgi:2-polyprenyl-6-methoxyphenol hydroxylase-like FAD-dependent oxidoreductase
MRGMAENLRTRCCIAGGGPAGMMLGFLLARAGIDVLVLEKHKDFLRDFRGDTIHPSTLELMFELGILDEFLKQPHQKVLRLSGQIGSETIEIGDFTHLSTHCKFIALMPQWDFLNFIVSQARAYPGFHLRTQSEATEVIAEGSRIAGLRVRTPDGPLEVRADLTIGADGRHSTVRKSAGLEVIDQGAPMDVMWMRISRRADDPGQTFGHVEPGRILVMLNREAYWQCAYVIPKGSADAVRGRGLLAFREEIAKLEPFLRDRVSELQDWKQVSELTVTVDRLAKWWRPGLLCIGDAAHAMSPIGGVGINLAIQDAVAAANILGPQFLNGNPSDQDLDALQRRRTFPTRATQKIQIVVQNRVIRHVLRTDRPLAVPWQLKLLRAFPFLRQIPARIVGVGFRPEHVKLNPRTPPRE